MAYALQLHDGIVLVRNLPGVLPAMADVVEVDGRSWRVLERRMRVSASHDGERVVECVVVVEPEAAPIVRADG